MVMVEVGKGEPVDKALKRFKKACEQAGIVAELKRREFYMKPSEKKALKRRELMRKIAKAKRRQERYHQRKAGGRRPTGAKRFGTASGS